MAIIQNRTVTTTDILTAMSSYAANYALRTSQVDFDIKSFNTELRRVTSRKWESLGDASSLDKKDLASDSSLDFRQFYTIELKPKVVTDDFRFISTISTNKLKTQVSIVVDRKSILKAESGLEKLIKDEIIKKKARHGFFIGVWESKLDSGITELISTITDGRLVENKEIVASSVPFASDVVDSHIKYHLHGLSSGKNAIISIKEGTLIMEYYKPRSRDKSRNASGEYIPNLAAKNSVLITQIISDEDVEIVEDVDKISYTSKKDGFFVYNNKEFKVIDEINVKNLNFKDTGYIVANLDDDIEINVKELDQSKDAISTGVVVEVQKLTVVGNVAGNTTLTTKIFKSTGGGVQNGSLITSEHAEIKMLKGKLMAKSAVIETLENGIIYADEVEIYNAHGGKVYANKITIKKVNSHTKFVAKSLIDIHDIFGYDNKFIIDIYANPEIKSQFKLFRAELALIEEKIEDKFSKEAHERRIRELQNALFKTVSKIDDFKSKKIAPPVFLKDEVERFKTELKIEKYFLHEKGIEAIASIYRNNLKKLSYLVYKGKIVSQTSWKGSMNKIIFEKRYAGTKVEHIPMDNEREFMLKRVTDGEDKIVSRNIS
jgi:hypothetical protein